jgi:hypothetical protein
VLYRAGEVSRINLHPQNAYTTRLKDINFDIHKALAVDLLHEVEIGIWKAVLEHLVRLLYGLPGGNELVATLNIRLEFHSFYGIMQRLIYFP